MNKTKFYAICPKTRAEFVAKFNSDYVFRNYAKNMGFSVIQENVIFPDGKVADIKVK